METVVTLTKKQDAISKKNGSNTSSDKYYRVEMNVPEERVLELVEEYSGWTVGYYRIQT